ncbi:MAG: trypsin-like peptidase domain-containing protein [Candidatus Pacebacteria bacterium]|nr:trypsin-like peptidase domain-containing protein [Candidatus Paceibacterota bacterium]
MEKQIRKLLIIFLIVGFSGSFVSGFLGGIFSSRYLLDNSTKGFVEKDIKETQLLGASDYESRIIEVINKSENSVVSVIATKDLPVIEEYYINPFEDFGELGPFGFYFRIPQYRQKGTELKEVSAGSGFVADSRGYIITNRHVVEDLGASYTVLMNDGEKYPAQVIARDLVEDFAVLKIEKSGLVPLNLGDSSNLALGQTVIAIGNALGEFQNTVSCGVISGLSRSIQATDSYGKTMVLNDVIQTDAAINEGNSGGPLLDLNGEVIGVNVAKVSGAENIGFAIPINKIKNALKQAIETGGIKIPYLGVRYILVNPTIQEEKQLPVNYGALLLSGENNEPAVEENSPAWKAGLKEGDIILELNNQKIDQNNQLATLIRQYNVGDKVVLKILRGEETLTKEVVLGEYSIK